MNTSWSFAEYSYLAAFMTGLLGSAHCLGMCGALVSGFFMKNRDGGMRTYAAYHAARLAIYSLIGLVAAAIGTVLVASGGVGVAQGLLQILAGAIVILLGLDIAGLSPIRNSLGFAPIAWLRKQFVGATRRGPVVGAAIAGAINGMMPCSMTMAMAVQATTAPSIPEGILLMLVFGAGTLPSMLSASVLFGKLGPRLRGWLLRIAALFVIGLGLATLWQGLRFYWVMIKLV